MSTWRSSLIESTKLRKWQHKELHKQKLVLRLRELVMMSQTRMQMTLLLEKHLQTARKRKTKRRRKKLTAKRNVWKKKQPGKMRRLWKICKKPLKSSKQPLEKLRRDYRSKLMMTNSNWNVSRRRWKTWRKVRKLPNKFKPLLQTKRVQVPEKLTNNNKKSTWL